MNIEAFVYLVLFIFFGLLAIFVRWLKGEFEKATEQERTPMFSDLPEEGHPIEITEFGRRSQPDFQEKLFSSNGILLSRKRRRKPKFDIRAIKDFRQGIVLMTILGPCRAFEPPAEFRNLG